VRANHFVLESIVEESEDFADSCALKCKQVFNCVYIEWIPLKFQASRVDYSCRPCAVKCRLHQHISFDPLEHCRVKQIVYLLVVNLKKRNIEVDALGLSERSYHVD